MQKRGGENGGPCKQSLQFDRADISISKRGAVQKLLTTFPNANSAMRCGGGSGKDGLMNITGGVGTFWEGWLSAVSQRVQREDQ